MLGYLMKYRVRLALFAFCIGVIFTYILTKNAFDNLLEYESDKFEILSKQVHDTVSRKINASDESILNLATLFNSLSKVDAEQFRDFSAEILSRHKYIHSLQYLPFVSYANRGDFEYGMHRAGYVTFSISEYRDGHYITALPREQYYPVLYQEPFTPYTASVLGFDILTDPILASVAEKAIDTSGVVAVLSQNKVTNEKFYLLAKALYSGKKIPNDVDKRRKDVNGLIMLRITPNGLLDLIQKDEHLEVSITAQPTVGDKKSIELVHHKGNLINEEFEWQISWNESVDKIELPGGSITIKMREPVHWEDTNNEVVVISFILGLLFTFVLVIGAYFIAQRTRKLQDLNRKITLLVDQRTYELSKEKDSLEHEVKVRKQGEYRLIKQQESMLQLSTFQVSVYGEMESAIQNITFTSALTLEVERVSVWLFNNDHTQLKCIDLYLYSEDKHSCSSVMSIQDCPAYFKALEDGHVINADSARRDSRTSELSGSYLNPKNIYSVLSTPIKREGEIVGVVCHEHVREERHWRLDEQNFASSIADMVSLEIERDKRKEAETKTVKLSRALEHAADSVFITDSQGCIEYVNNAFEKITQYKSQEVIGKNASVISSNKHDVGFFENMWNTILEGKEYRDIFINRKKDGVAYYEEKTITPLRDAAGIISSFVSVGKDITERMQTQERLHFLAHHDILTELPNRAMLIERLNHALDHMELNNMTLAVMFLDLDRFKVINDTLGHNIGDLLLQQVADRLRTCMRKTDTVARIGGDEFVVLLEDIGDSEHISNVASNVIETLEQPFDLEGREVFVTSSIGISVYPHDGLESNALLKNADTAMYRAKDHGRNNYQFYSAEMSSKALEKLTLETDLRYALSRNEFILYYQPQINLQSGELKGCEALLRWQHPKFGMLSPSEFIPLLEDTGMIISVGEWVLREACKQCKQWQQEGIAPFPIAVNLSARQFSDANLADSISNILMDVDFDPSLLQLEITENVVMQNAVDTIKILNQLKSLGVELAVDDFGTGYSSLSYLKRFPIDVLKIDRSFVRDITTDPDDASIVSTVISLAHSLNLTVIAEGVETEAQARFLADRSCDTTQGYLYSKPVPANEIKSFLNTKLPIVKELAS